MGIKSSLLFIPFLTAGFLINPAIPTTYAQDNMAEYDRMMAACVNEVAPDYAASFYAVKNTPLTADNFKDVITAAREKAKPFTADNLADLSKCIKEKGYKISAIDDFSMYVQETLENPDESEEIARKYGVGEPPALGSDNPNYTPVPRAAPQIFLPPQNKNKEQGAPTLFNKPQ